MAKRKMKVTQSQWSEFCARWYMTETEGKGVPIWNPLSGEFRVEGTEEEKAELGEIMEGVLRGEEFVVD